MSMEQFAIHVLLLMAARKFKLATEH